MAKLVSKIEFTGSLEGLSAYRMRGVEGIVLRKKGGPSREKVRSSESFANTRRNNAEFSGRATASRWIMTMMERMKALADYNIAGPLNALLKPVQGLDTDSAWGQRHVLLSRNPGLLSGFSLNRYTPFDGIIRNAVDYTLDREMLTATVHIPQLIPDINFVAPKKHALFSVVAMLGVVPDLYFDQPKYKPSLNHYETFRPVSVETPWLPVLKGAPATSLNLSFPDVPADNSFSLMLSIGIRFGSMISAQEVMQTKHAGAAKILRVN